MYWVLLNLNSLYLGVSGQQGRGYRIIYDHLQKANKSMEADPLALIESPSTGI